MPVSRLNSVLLPALGLPTTAMRADGRRRTEIWSADIRVTDSLLTWLGWSNGEMLGLFPAQRDCVTKHADFQGVTAYR